MEIIAIQTIYNLNYFLNYLQFKLFTVFKLLYYINYLNLPLFVILFLFQNAAQDLVVVLATMKVTVFTPGVQFSDFFEHFYDGVTLETR